MSYYAKKYPRFPSKETIAEQTRLVFGVLHWAPVNGNPPQPTTTGPTLFLDRQRLPTRLVTWVCRYGSLPEYRLTHVPGWDGSESNITNFREVVPTGASAGPVEVTFKGVEGMILARVVPRRSQTYGSISDRIVVQKLFSNWAEAEEWTERVKLGMLAVRESSLKPKPNGHKVCPDLPSLAEIPYQPADLSQEELGLGLDQVPKYVPPPNPASLDMLSPRACQRFIGRAVHLARSNNGYQLSQDGSNRRGATVTVTLGAYDGAWRCHTVTVKPDGTQIEDISESQPQVLIGWRITETLHTSITPGKAPESLRKALLAKWRASPPSQDDLRRSRASLTAAPIPRLNADQRSKAAKTPLFAAIPLRLRAPQSQSQSQSQGSFSLLPFFDRLFTKLNPQDYVAPGNVTGVQVHIQRVTSGFYVSLRGAVRPRVDHGEPLRYTALVTGTIPSKIKERYLKEYPNTKAVFSRVTASSELSQEFISDVAKSIASRLAAEEAVRKIAASELRMPIPKELLPAPKKQTYQRSEGRRAGSPRSLLVTINVFSTLDTSPGAPAQEITCYLARAISHIQGEDLNDQNRTVPYEVARKRIKRGWDPRQAITTPIQPRHTQEKPQK